MSNEPLANLTAKLRSLVEESNSPFLPSYGKLSIQFESSPPTIAKALKQLEMEGHIRIRPRGKITILRNIKPTPKENEKSSTEIVYQDLYNRIQNGQYRVGTVLPKTRYLCSQMRISSRILCDAIKILEQKSLVYKVGKEWHVGTKQPTQKPIAPTQKAIVILGAWSTCWRSTYEDSRLSNFARTFMSLATSLELRLVYTHTHQDKKRKNGATEKKAVKETISKLGHHYLGTLFVPRKTRLSDEEMEEWLQLLAKFKKPIVWLDGAETGNSFWKGSKGQLYRCHFSEERFVRAAVDFLAERGHKKICYLKERTLVWHQNRYDMIQKICEEVGIQSYAFNWDKDDDIMKNSEEAKEQFVKRIDTLLNSKSRIFKTILHILTKLGGFRGKKNGENLLHFVQKNTNGPLEVQGAISMFKIVLSFDFIVNDPTTTALIFPNDLFARNALKAMKRARFQLPRDISVISFDNIPIGVPIFLNTVDYGFEELGYQALHTILKDVPVRADRNGNIPITPMVVDNGTVSIIPKDSQQLPTPSQVHCE